MFRLIEREPSWEVHAYLRFCGLSYRVEYSHLPTALGRRLPVLIDDQGVYSGDEIFTCIRSHAKQLHLTRDEKVVDEMVSNTLRRRFDTQLWDVLRLVTNQERDHILVSSPWGVNIYLAMLYDLQKFFSQSPDPNTLSTEDDLMKATLQFFQEVDEYLDHHSQSSICVNWPFVADHFEYYSATGSSRYLADALLFSYVIKAISHPKLHLRMLKFNNIEKFFTAICEQYFRDSHSPSKDNTWQVSLYRVMHNPYIRADANYEHIVLRLYPTTSHKKSDLMEYNDRSFDDENVLDEPTSLFVPTLGHLSNYEQYLNYSFYFKPALAPGEVAKTNTVTLPGVLFASSVLLCFGGYFLQTRFRK